MANVVAIPLPLPNALSIDALATQPLGAPLIATGDDRQEDGRSVQIARAFFEAATRLSEDNEDILPQVLATYWVAAFAGCVFTVVVLLQEDSPDLKLSVYYLFSELFPEFSHDKDKDPSGTTPPAFLKASQSASQPTRPGPCRPAVLHAPD